MDRRPVLTMLAAMACAAVAAMISLPVLTYILSPLRRRVEGADWIDLGAVEAIPEGIPVLIPYEIVLADGWERRSRPASAWVIRLGQRAEVLTSICPHLGCAVRWRREVSRYACPCHASAFAADGRRLSGPALRGLDPLPSRIENGRLFVRHLMFRPGVGERIPA